MEVSITQFRREMFDLVNRAFNGTEVWVRHNGNRFRIAPEGHSPSRLAHITPMEILNPDAPDLNDQQLKNELKSEMEKSWESDWSIL